MTNLEELGKRAVACKHWRWMPGMLTADGCRMLTHESTREWSACSPKGSFCDPSQYSIPNFDDPATKGCVLALVREALGDPISGVIGEPTPDGGRWCYMGGDAEEITPWLTSEAEALVAALKAAEALDHD